MTEFTNPDDHVALLASAVELTPDYMVENLRLYAVEPWGHVVLTLLSGTAIDRGFFESYILAVPMWGESGYLTLIAIYEPEDVDAALARLRECKP
ncbi:MAG: hypothetical protein ABWZ15_11405 [Acidimicrobiia bacterium]